VGGDGVALDLVGSAREVVVPLRQGAHLAAHLPKKFAVVRALDDGEALGVFGYKLGQTPHQPGPFRPGHPAPRPFVECLAGGANRPVHVFLTGLGRGGPHLAGEGVYALEGLARAGFDPLAAHEHLVTAGLFGLGLLDQLHPCLLLRHPRIDSSS
jgi:hypothetical protein